MTPQKLVLLLAPKWLRPSNGTFDGDVTGWSAYSAGPGGTVTWATDGTMLVSNNGGTYARGVTSIATLTGFWYEVSIEVVSTTNTATLRAATASDGASGYLGGLVGVAAGRRTFKFQATGTTTYLACGNESNAGAATSKFDDVKYRKSSPA